MAARPRKVVALGAVAVIIGYGALIGSGMIRAPWLPAPSASTELLAGMNSGVFLDTREGSRNANRSNDSLTEQAPLDNIALFPEETSWWTARCRGFFMSLFRAELAATQVQVLRENGRLFPMLENLPAAMRTPDGSNAAAMNQMKRYERSFPLLPGEIPGTTLYQTDLPICLDVAQGVFPKRP